MEELGQECVPDPFARLPCILCELNFAAVRILRLNRKGVFEESNVPALLA